TRRDHDDGNGVAALAAAQPLDQFHRVEAGQPVADQQQVEPLRVAPFDRLARIEAYLDGEIRNLIEHERDGGGALPAAVDNQDIHLTDNPQSTRSSDNL